MSAHEGLPAPWGVGGGVGSVVSGPAMDRILDTYLEKHYLSVTSFADGKYRRSVECIARGNISDNMSLVFYIIFVPYHGSIRFLPNSQKDPHSRYYGAFPKSVAYFNQALVSR